MEGIRNASFKIDLSWRYVIYFIVFILIHIFFTPEENRKIVEIIISAIGGLISLVIFIVGYKNDRDRRENITYRVGLLMASVFYILAELIWYSKIMILEMVPHPLGLSKILYIFLNISLGCSIYSMIKQDLGKWSRAKILVDGFFIGGILSFVVWKFFAVPFFNIHEKKGFEVYEVISGTIHIFINLVMVFFLYMFYSLQKNQAKKKNNIIQGLGFLVWFLGDIIHIYFNLVGEYENYNRLIDTLWPVSLLIIALSSIKGPIIEESQEEKTVEKNLEVSNIFFIIMVTLSSVVIYYGDKKGLVILIPTLLFRHLISKHIDIYERNEELNAKNKEDNKLLIEINKKLYDLANIDPLTQIYNRRRLIEELENLTSGSKVRQKFALLFVDLDKFKNINDNYGHDVGDLLLKEVVKKISNTVDAGDFVARQGGDEFVIIFKNIKSKEYVTKKCKEILNSTGRIFILDGKKIKTSVSIGVAFFPEHAQDYIELMKCSDRALYKSKTEGKNQFHIYDEELQQIQDRKFMIENRLQNARMRKELYLLYQPQIDVKTGKIMGIEALLRWKNSELGEVSPKEFIPIAEETGVIHSLGEFAIEEAMKDIKYINSRYSQDIKVSVNVSPKQFFNDALLPILKKNISKNNVQPSWIGIEITENMSMTNEKEVIKRLEAMTKLGISISIDDFGTGYSSLSYLKNYPISIVKIASELVRDIDKGKQDYNIVKAITAMCREMGIKTIAEGVESLEHFQILKDFGCDRIQGYFFSKPKSLEEVEREFLN